MTMVPKRDAEALVSNQQSGSMSDCEAPANIEELIASRDRDIAELRQQLADAQAAIRKHDREIQLVYQQCADALEAARSLTEHFSVRLDTIETNTAEVARQTQEILRSRIWRTLCFVGSALLGARSWLGDGHPVAQSSDNTAVRTTDYERWIAEFEARDPAWIDLKMRSFTIKPRISIAVAVIRDTGMLMQAIRSVMGQSYGNWELCVAVNASQSATVKHVLGDCAHHDLRVKTAILENDASPVLCWNTALRLADGEFAVLLGPEDKLAQDTLFHFVDALNRQPNLDLIYSDEDNIDEHGGRHGPFFKPDWSPDLILSENYLANGIIFRRDLFRDADLFRAGLEGAEQYDLVLRLTEQTERIGHIPRVLYHRRQLTPSILGPAAAGRVIQEHLLRREIEAQVEPGLFEGLWRVRYPLHPEPAVSIIIPSGGNVGVLRKNLESHFNKTAYRNYEIVIVDNSRHDTVAKLVAEWPDPPRPLRRIDCRNRVFNFATINNQAARQCTSPMLLFLNDDTSVITPDWLTAMVELSARPEVGAVGAKLLYPDGTIQHAGVALGIFGNCGHAFKSLPGDAQHYFDFPDVIRNVSAVTGACLMTRLDVFRETGGFDEQNFAVAFNDVDFCLRVREKGYRVIYTPHAQLYHYESFSKTTKDIIPRAKEVQALQSRWKDLIDADPYYSPNLTRTAEDYSLGRKTQALTG